MLVWPHRSELFTTVPAVLTACTACGIAAAFAFEQPLADRLLVAIVAPFYLFIAAYFVVSLLLRVLGRLRPGGRAVLVATYYFGVITLLLGAVLVALGYLGLSPESGQERALDALQSAGAIGTMVAAKQQIDRRDKGDRSLRTR